jgi:hypothetical protein
MTDGSPAKNLGPHPSMVNRGQTMHYLREEPLEVDAVIGELGASERLRARPEMKTHPACSLSAKSAGSQSMTDPPLDA